MPTEIEITGFTLKTKKLLDNIDHFPAGTALAQIPGLFQEKMALLRNWPLLTEAEKHTHLKAAQSSYDTFVYELLTTRITGGHNGTGFYALEEAITWGDTKIVLFLFTHAKELLKSGSDNTRMASTLKKRLVEALRFSMDTRQVEVLNALRDFIYQLPLDQVGSSWLPDFDWKYWQTKNMDIAAQNGQTEPFEQYTPSITDNPEQKSIAPLWYSNVKNKIRTYTVIGNWHSITLKKEPTEAAEITMVREHTHSIRHGETLEFKPKPGLDPFILMVAYQRALMHKQDKILKLLDDFPIPTEQKEHLDRIFKNIILNSSVIIMTTDKHKIDRHKGLTSMFLNYYQKNNMQPPEELSEKIKMLKKQFNL